MAGLANNNNPFSTQARNGPNFIQLVPGPKGDPGPAGGTVTTTANFTQPAVNSSVSVSVTTSAGSAQGQTVFVAGGGFYTVASIPDGTHLSLTNLGTSGNLTPGLTVNNGAVVVGSGPSVPATVPVASGGTGVTTLVAHAVVVGEGTSPVASVGPGTAGQVLTSNGASADPSFQTPASVVDPPPSVPVMSGTHTLSAAERWVIIGASGVTLDARNVVAGQEVKVSIRASTVGFSGVTLSRGTASFTMEQPDDQTQSPLTTATFGTTGVTYRIELDSTANVLRCVGAA